MPELTRKGCLLVVSTLTLLTAVDRGSGATGPHGTVDLVAEQVSVQAERPFWVGLYFHLEPGWHIYWTNPGDSGEPPRVKWNLPAGFQAGSLQWPVPQRIADHSLIDYGYQQEVLLPAEIRPSEALPVGSSVQLSAMVNWLVCRDICIPGRASLELTLPAESGTTGRPSAQHALFAKARADLPHRAPPFWKVTANLEERRFILVVDTGKQEAGATFFPLEPDQIENAAPQKASPYSRGIRLELAKSDQLLKPPARLAGVLELSSGQGYVIEPSVVISK